MADTTQRAAMQAERKALETYLKECDDFAIVPDVGGAWAAAWRAARAENTTPTLREAAQQFVQDYENGDLGDLKHYARSMRAALAEQAAEQAVIPPAFAHAASQQMAVTSEWCRGWDACRAHILSAAPAAEQAEPVTAMIGKCQQCGHEHEIPPAPARQEPLADLPPNEKLLALADRIDHEKLWSRAGLERPDWTQEQHDRCDAGVHLRRYAGLLGQNRWRIYPPHGSTVFSAETLDGALRMARKHERMFPAAPITAAPAEGGAA